MAKVDLAGKLETARARVEAETPAEDRGLAKFARLTRKDARVRADQDAALAALAKSLMRRRPVKAERITENTLIRVAIDLLLAHADELRGSTEDELRESVTAEPSHSRTPERADSRGDGPAASRAPDAASSRGVIEPKSGGSTSPDPRDARGTGLASDPAVAAAPAADSRAMGR